MNHWDKFTRSRVSRRRVLVSSSATLSAALLLAACGGDGDDGSGDEGPSDLLAQPVDTTKKAVRGGVLKEYATREPSSLDPITTGAGLNEIAKYPFGTLLAEKRGHLEPSRREISGDLAESWELSPDKLQLTLKLRPNVKFHNKPPVNGRAVDVDDVLFSWKRFSSSSALRGTVANSANPSAPVLSLTASDPRTIVVKLKEPRPSILNAFAWFGTIAQNIVMLPRESDGGYDPRSDMIGHGPYELAKATPSVGYMFKRNREYYDPDWGLVDEIEMPLVLEYAARLAQLKAGNIHRLFGPDPQAADVPFLKGDQPDLQIYQTGLGTDGAQMTFGQLPGSIFQDVRVRRAVSMAIDRDAWLEAIYSVSSQASSGFPVEGRWHSHLHATWEGLWIDPKSSEFGSNGKNFQYNIEEAKKLLAAAGYSNGLDVISNYPLSGADFRRFAEPLDGMMDDVGIRIKHNAIDFGSEYAPKYRDAQGQFEGWLYSTLISGAQDPASQLASEYWSQAGATFRGFSADPTKSKAGDPELDRLIEKARIEFEPAALKSQLGDIQRYLGGTMWGLVWPGGATGFSAAWPAVQNHNTWRRVRQNIGSGWDAYQVWLDKTQAPLA